MSIFARVALYEKEIKNVLDFKVFFNKDQCPNILTCFMEYIEPIFNGTVGDSYKEMSVFSLCNCC